MKKVIVFVLCVLFFFPFGFVNAQEEQISSSNLAKLKEEIDFFLGRGAQAYIVWQYSGPADNPSENDPYSFFQGSPVCGVLQEASQKYPGKIGVNMHSLARHDAGYIESTISYLSSQCGVSIIRAWGSPDRGGPASMVTVLDSAARHNVQIISVLADYSNTTDPILPGDAQKNPAKWYGSGYRTSGYLDFAVKSAATYGNHSALWAFELANEAHCNGQAECAQPYFAWAKDVRAAIQSKSSARVSIGQKANEAGSPGDGPDIGDFATSNRPMDLASAHYYTASERELAIQAMNTSPVPFYIGEVGLKFGEEASGEVALPFEILSVACTETGPEFHSLRPYPTNACNPNVEETVLLCGNDLIAKNSLEGFPIQGPCGLQDVDISTGESVPAFVAGSFIRCTFDYENLETDVTVDLSDSELPIAGNTEDVPNATQGVDSGNSFFSFVQRMTEYVSWYLNGVPFRAEEPPPDEQAKAYAPDLDQNVANTDVLINFSGPLRKLLPRDLNREYRQKQKDDIGETRHNQIVTCNSQANPEECYTQSDPRTINMNRVPAEGRPSSQYIPYSSTEDRVGDTYTDPNSAYLNSIQIPLGQQGQEVQISSVQFVPDSDSLEFVHDKLYFAHMEEDSELADILQNTFSSVEQDNYSGNLGSQQVAELDVPDRCEILDSRSNSGDDLYAEDATKGDNQIRGKLTFDAKFQCVFNVDQGKYKFCIAGGGSEDACTWEAVGDSPCEQTAYTAMSVFTKTPKGEELWERLVDGSQSIFKRIFPKVGVDTPVEEIEDIPGAASANYTSTADQTLAGDPSKGRSGGSAQLFFPHLGSVYDYFLQGIQKALNPKDVGEITSGPNKEAEQCEINCNQSASLLPAAQAYSDLKPLVEDFANRWVGQTGQNYASECFNDVVNRSVQAGVNPYFTLMIWLNESGASNYSARNTSCQTQDFGINSSALASPANFDQQINAFLSLFGSSGYRSCMQQLSSPTRGFLFRFRGCGEDSSQPWYNECKKADACSEVNQAGQDYYEKIQPVWNLLTNCPFPSDPTDMSCK